ncbi:hypothetical protein SETIT_2G176400v2 [Setaria italica]|uniref:Uncharacterized protein n=1 Tax=Setaria italica TaxID=4555 RepID=A0A368Q0K0_SETIT|nr:hypothetical protein SETIT_2G176400v2 [Setaria italica]
MAFLMQLVKPILMPVYNLIFKHAAYPFKISKNVKDFREATNDLHAKSKDVQDHIEIVERQGMSASNEVQWWLGRVKTIRQQEEQIGCKYDQRYKIFGCYAAEKVRCVKEFQRAPSSVQEMPCSSTAQQPSRVAMLQEALRCITNDPVGVIEIWGLGGVGKTHLLTEINNSSSGMHPLILFVTASKDCSVRKIQDEIVDKLHLCKGNDVRSQAKIIFKFFSKRTFLILLDDIWDRIDLHEVGIPLVSINQMRRKVVLTTRSKNVCGLMEVRKYINVACLPNDEAWHLFKDKVGLETLSSPLIEALAKELSCCDKDDPLCMESVFRQLKFSYDRLRNDTLRQCFLTCSLWPEDKEIQMEALAECWLGLGLVDERDIHKSNIKVHSIIGELKATCLLENYGVKRHDMVRGMALWIACGCDKSNDKWVVHAGVGVNSSTNTIDWSKAECISLMWNKMTDLPPIDPNPCFRRLRILDLRWNMLDQRIFVAIQSFTALTYLNLSCNRFTNIAKELCTLVNLEYLSFSSNPLIYEMPECLRKLTKLKFLNLGGTNIGLIPKGAISSLKALEVLDLRTLEKFSTTSIFVELCTLSNLKAVHIHWIFVVAMVQIEVRDNFGKPFENLSMLKLGSLMNLREIPWKEISALAIFPRLTQLHIVNCPEIQHISWATYCPCLEYVDVSFCHNMKQEA